jgi:hypothetical protein
MAYIQIVGEDEAQGRLAEDYAFLSSSYGRGRGNVATPQVYRTNSIVEPYFHFGAVQNRALTHDGTHARRPGPLPDILVNFAVSLYSSCYY